MQRLLVGFLLLGGLAGCGSYKLTLMSSDGTMGAGHATGMGTGTLEIALNGKVYRGTWAAAQGGAVAFGTAGTTTLLMTSADTSAAGSAMLKADDGSALQCRFVYGEWSSAGMGQCRDSAGRVYDLQIT